MCLSQTACRYKFIIYSGARYVALITGEEKIIPPDARWFSCTVEAMPLDRYTEFVAVDEIQLCADPDRGHVFTERLLHARGMVETMFLGAETIRPLLQRLVPNASVETRPRLSQLSYAGPAKLVRLPPRSAVVAFSAAEVYAIAEAIRSRRGGCAVVMGRLSPRTRNAQVALYQDKEVDFLVATDAIGMGLNMDVNHVAFAGLSKYDGHKPRRLFASEVAQIAGRAGRGMRDGTFGTTGECRPLTEDIVEAVEQHQFEPLTQLAWRNAALDFSSLEALIASLNTAPPHAVLARGNEAMDLETLIALSRDADIRSLATSRNRIRLLWEACQIPDFRKLSDETHNRFCARLFGHLVRDGRLPADWIAGQIAAHARADGDIDTLMQRLAGIRVWTYVAARSDWLHDAVHWQARAREVEDLLSDALHERLTARFVDRRAALLMRRLDGADREEMLSAVTRRGEVVVEGHQVGHVEGFGFVPDPLTEGEGRRLVLRAARRALRQEMPLRVDRLLAAADSDFALLPSHRIAWEGVPVARLRAGATALRPQVEVLDSEFLDGAQRERIRQRLQGFADAHIKTCLAPLYAAIDLAARESGLRGPLHLLVEGLGVAAPITEAAGKLRGWLKTLGVRSGRHALFVPALLKPRAAALRAQLWAVRQGIATPALPPPAAVSIPPPDWPAGFAAAMGWVEAGPVLVRLDIAETLSAELAWATRARPIALPPGLAPRLSVKTEWLPAVLRSLGFRILPAIKLTDDQYGPDTPPMLAARRRAKPEAPVDVAPRGDSPFAALATFRR